jgi:hypothetical protein
MDKLTLQMRRQQQPTNILIPILVNLVYMNGVFFNLDVHKEKLTGDFA